MGFGSPKVPTYIPTTTTTATVTADPAIEEARRKELLANAKSRGRAATLLTGGDGDTSAVTTANKRLLGE